MDLVRGQRVRLADVTSSQQLSITLRASGVDAARLQFFCLLLDHKGVAVGPQPLVYDAKVRSDCGSVMLNDRQIAEQTFCADLTRVPSGVTHLLFGLAIESPTNLSAPIHADLIREGSVVVKGEGGTARHVFKGSDFEKETAVELIEIYRKDETWRIAVVSAGFVGGLNPLLSRHHAPLITGPVPAGRLSGSQGAPGFSPAPEGITVPENWPGSQIPTLPQGLVPCVGLVIVRTVAGETHSGTAFAISPGGYCVTCHHVVENAESVSLCFEGTSTLRPCLVIASDADSDLALLWLADRNGSPAWMMLSSADPVKEPQLGDDLGLLGYPLGIDLGLSVTYSQGIVNSLRRRGELPVLQIDTGAAPGSSGGPVFRRSDGRVVGILTSGLNPDRGGMHINFAMGIRAFWRLGWLTTP